MPVKKLIILFVLCFSVKGIQAQISGPTSVYIGQSASYTFNNNTVYTSWTWGVLTGTITNNTRSGTVYNLTVSWSTTGTVNMSFLDNTHTVRGTYSVNVINAPCTPADPVINTPSFSSSNCVAGPYVLTYPAVSGVTMFWQSVSSGGTSTTSTGPLTITAAGTYYLRALATANLCWSTNTTAIVVTLPPIPAAADFGYTTNACGLQTLTQTGSPGSGVSWYWEGTNSAGTSTSSPAATPYTVSTSGSYYLGAYNGHCWNSLGHSINVNPIPATPPTPVTSANSCGPVTLTPSGGPATGVSWYWQGTNATGQDASSATAKGTTYSAPASGTYYIRAMSTANCWSSGSPVNTYVNSVDLLINKYDPANTLAVATHSIDIKPGFDTGAGGSFDTKITATVECNNYVNWTENILYDQNGQTISRGKSYTNGFGKALQSQAIDMATGKVWASQPLYDHLNNPVASTLAAPILAYDFVYQTAFVRNASRLPYSPSDFDLTPTNNLAAGEVYNPNPVDTTSGTLGAYYSPANKAEPLTPVTGFPYARDYSPPGPNPTTAKSAGPGDYHHMGSTHESRSDKYLIAAAPGELSNYYSSLSSFSTSTNTAQIGYKYMSTDADGKQTVTYTDGDGRTIATAIVTSGTGALDYWSYNYYNDAGQLTASVTPAGVNGTTTPSSFITYYYYDQKGQLIKTTSPDGGTSQFVYSSDGKIRFSQNQTQYNATPQRFSYTNYDYLGRLIESGEYTQGNFIFQPASTGSPATNSILNLSILDNTGFSGTANNLEATACSDATKIYYDFQQTDGVHPVQTYLYGKISKTSNQNATTWYSYDENGQLTWTVQNIGTTASPVYKRIDYTTDYFNNITQVAYQAAQPDAFYHHYTYDVDQRLATASTSKDGVTKTLQAKYYYYLHGPLKRVELAGNLQGIDYVYNINGSLKSINGVDVASDPGKDGAGTTPAFSSDVFGESIDYYSNDYIAANGTKSPVTVSGLTDNYGGNIKSTSWHTPVDQVTAVKSYGYTYDNLNQLSNAQWGGVTSSTGGSPVSYTTSFPAANNPYNEAIPSYDKNGNMSGLNRTGKAGSTGPALAAYTYSYYPGTNRLQSVNNSGTPLTHYNYNEIGQVTQATEAGNTLNMVYNAYGVIKEVRDGSNNLLESYAYDDRGNKLSKTNYVAGVAKRTTTYVSDAAGNTLAIYSTNLTSGVVTLVEVPVYGADRIGEYKPSEGTGGVYYYEMKDHLGNVRSVIGASYTDTFLATMEDANATQEAKWFPAVGITPTTTKPPANHTPGGSKTLALSNAKSAGGGIYIQVAPGDQINAEVYAYYEGGSGYSNLAAASALFPVIETLFGGVSGAAGDPGKIYNAFNAEYGPGGLIGVAGTSSDNVPAAYLNMIMFDENLLTDASLPKVAVPITSAASFAQQKLTFPQTITIPSPGYVYIFLSYNSNTITPVYFDDLKVTHLHSPFVAGGDFFPYGLAIDDRQIKVEPYRFGYQGQYSEKDSITNTNNFQLRMYEPRFGGGCPRILMANLQVHISEWVIILSTVLMPTEDYLV